MINPHFSKCICSEIIFGFDFDFDFLELKGDIYNGKSSY